MRDDIASPKCPRGGFVVLKTGYRDFVVPTTCKTWRCSVCSNKVRQLTAMKMMYGCLSTGKPSHFITVTYRNRAQDRTRSAKDVEREWAVLWRRLRKLEAWKKAEWIKVPELTARGQVHLHGIVINLVGQDTCRVKTTGRKKWMQRRCSSNCLEHDLAKTWDWVTEGVSFVVDCQQIRSVAGTASYVQKYMGKMFGEDRKRLQALHFKKRWTCSRNWPRLRLVKLRGTEEALWEQVTRFHGSKAVYYDDTDLNHEWSMPMKDLALSQEREAPVPLERVGSEYALEMRRLAINRKEIKEVMKGFGIEI